MHATVRTLNCSQRSIVEAIRHLVASTPEKESLFVIDLGAVYRKVTQWNTLFPAIGAFFAVKALPDPLVLRALMSMGVGFDCASTGEMEKVLQLGGDPKMIIFSNTCKPPGAITYAKNHGIEWMTFDNEYEVVKIKKLYPDAK
jgi:ornithine decarboxylase